MIVDVQKNISSYFGFCGHFSNDFDLICHTSPQSTNIFLSEHIEPTVTPTSSTSSAIVPNQPTNQPACSSLSPRPSPNIARPNAPSSLTTRALTLPTRYTLAWSGVGNELYCHPRGASIVGWDQCGDFLPLYMSFSLPSPLEFEHQDRCTASSATVV